MAFVFVFAFMTDKNYRVWWYIKSVAIKKNSRTTVSTILFLVSDVICKTDTFIINVMFILIQSKDKVGSYIKKN